MTRSEATGSDALLAQRAAAGDQAAFAALVRAHSASMARLSFAICEDGETARDAVQTAWAIAWRRLGTLREPNRVRSWLLSLSANEARRLSRRQRLRTIAEARSGLGETKAASNRFEDVADLSRALLRLDAKSRELLGLRYGLGLNSVEIAAHLGSTPGAIRVRVARVLHQLRKELDRG